MPRSDRYRRDPVGWQGEPKAIRRQRGALIEIVGLSKGPGIISKMNRGINGSLPVSDKKSHRGPEASALDVVLSFDVEEHDLIEAAAGLALDPALRARAAARLAPAT